MDEPNKSTAGVGYRAKLTKDSTPQNVYDEIKAALAAGNFPAIDNDRVCRYRTKEGKACVAGIFIPDDSYSFKMEGICLQNIFKDIEHPEFLLQYDKSAGYDTSLLRELQVQHDSFYWKDYNSIEERDKHFLENIRGAFLKYGFIVE